MWIFCTYVGIVEIVEIVEILEIVEIEEIVEIVEIRRILGILEVLGILMDLKRWNLKGFEWKWMDLKIFEGIDWHVWTFMNLFALRSYARMCLFLVTY